MVNIYVVSSRKNQYYPEVVKRLKDEGHAVYDFRNPPHGGGGSHWTDVDENAPNWTFEQYADGLSGNLRQIWRPGIEQTPASWSSLAAAAHTLKPDGLPARVSRRLSICRRSRA